MKHLHEAKSAKRLAAQRAARRERTPVHVLETIKRSQYRRKLRKALGYVPTFAADVYRGFRDCLGGDSL